MTGENKKRESLLPPPEIVERYEALHPGAIGRILSMAERAQEYQITSMRETNENVRRDAQRGAILGSIVAVASMFGAAYCASINQPWVAGAFLGVPVISVARALIETSRKR